jgi:rubrerythrin
MTQFGSVDEVLDFAISREEEASAFYMKLAGQMDNPAMRRVFEDFAREELGHKTKLLAVKRDQTLAPAGAKVLDLKLADYLVAQEAGPDLDYAQALVVAMKREKAAFKLYHDLAAATDSQPLKDTFLSLAQEEAKHKLRFELEYDERVMTEN